MQVCVCKCKIVISNDHLDAEREAAEDAMDDIPLLLPLTIPPATVRAREQGELEVYV
jgi:hypothetical protein